MAVDDEVRARRELQGHHRLPQRQRLQPGDGARRDPGLGRLLGESAGTRPQWLTEKKVSVLLSFTLERKGQLPDVPTLLELAPPDKKDIVEFLAAGTPLGRAMAVGPGVPADRVAVLRKAFDGLMKDQAFLADARSATSTSTRATRRTPMRWPTSSPPPRPT